MWLRLIACTLLLAVSSPFLGGCAGPTVDENDPSYLYKEAEDDISGNRYLLAIDKLRLIKNKYPYSKFSVDAQLRIADVYFLQESYGEAALAYEAFRDLHPKHAKAAYATFRMAKAYFLDAPPNVARDQASMQKAMEAYSDFLKRFPEATEATEARNDLNQAKRQLAEKELYIGNFYFKRQVFGAARARFSKLVALYPDTDAAKEAQQKLAQIPNEEASPHGGTASGN